MLLKAKINGQERKVVVQGGKSAEWFAWDAKTGEVIYKNVAFGKIDHPDPTPEGVLVYPGVLGGTESNILPKPQAEQIRS